jgi:hypothetical protein
MPPVRGDSSTIRNNFAKRAYDIFLEKGGIPEWMHEWLKYELISRACSARIVVQKSEV